MEKIKYIEWLTPEKFAELYKMLPSTQAKKRLAFIWEDGKKVPNPDRLPYSRIGRFVRYDRAKIDKFFEDRAVNND